MIEERYRCSIAAQIDIEEACHLTQLHRDQILSDLGKNLLKARWIDGQWRFTRDEFFIYHYFQYASMKDSSTVSVAEMPGITVEEIVDTYGQGVRCFEGSQILSHAVFSGCTLRGIDLSLSNIVCGDFSGADLQSSDFQGTNLFQAVFQGANLANCDFRGANLEGSNFRGANLEGAIFCEAKLDRVNFQESIIKKTHFWTGFSVDRAK